MCQCSSYFAKRKRLVSTPLAFFYCPRKLAIKKIFTHQNIFYQAKFQKFRLSIYSILILTYIFSFCNICNKFSFKNFIIFLYEFVFTIYFFKLPFAKLTHSSSLLISKVSPISHQLLFEVPLSSIHFLL